MITLEKLSTNYSKLKDKIEDIILDVIAEYKNIADWCAYRTVRKYHIVDTKLKPGYHESDTLVMHSVFSILVDFVEMQKAWMHVICDDDLYCKLSWFERKFRYQNFRSAQYGIAYLNWEITETNARQSEAAQEILDLYTWWTLTRPQRADPDVLCGYNDVVTDDFYVSLTLAERIAKLSPILRNMNKIENKYEKEDEKMMIRLIKVRISLWT